MRAAVYQRRVSVDEARAGYLFVLKGSVPFFPPLGREFRLESPAGAEVTCLEAEACACRGPEKPHQHWRLPVGGLARGQRVRVEKLSEDAYRLVVVD
ncbi:MAG: hypothetical protein IT304_11850 [Dehalococcoidia bacterium]|nr:hypothetical protein [Dehalococcoidia bacterium]